MIQRNAIDSDLMNVYGGDIDCASHRWPMKTIHGVVARSTAARSLVINPYCGLPDRKSCSASECIKLSSKSEFTSKR